ncbi:MAG TPA: Ig-like domain-containing protein [Chthonomonas sp.]|uniref:Ig-like domain-containing protein n=1 Tax=Chthonomonas sp. TaxID=2282153 RepID=UPI002B4AD73D|nr:Ig-like domain-containing protein [Chthonomonas sp.]HLI49860.1 Ig-like domain-containing protein [Chthonomonas sp.]
MVRKSAKRFVWMLAGLVTLCSAVKLTAQPATDDSVPTYLLRVTNALYAPVEISVDGGKTFLVIGRVIRCASMVGADVTARQAGRVIRSGHEGVAISLGGERILKLLPQPAVAKAHLEPWAIYTNIAEGKGVFGTLVPPVGTKVLLPLSALNTAVAYSPQVGDVFEFTVERMPPPFFEPSAANRLNDWKMQIAQAIQAMANDYAAGAVARAQAEHRLIVSGFLTLKAKLPEGEPDPIEFVRFLVDGAVVQLTNVPPFTYKWDTRSVADGEHVVEIDALDKNGKLITQASALIVVQNHPATSAASAP